MENNRLTGYPSIDKPWLKYYSDEQINTPVPHETVFSYASRLNKNRQNMYAIDSAEGKLTYQETFEIIERTAASLQSLEFCKKDIALIMLPAMSYEVFLFYAIDFVGGAMSFLSPGTTIENICDSIRKFSTKYLFIYDKFLNEEMKATIFSTTNLKKIIIIGWRQESEEDDRVISWDDFIKQGIGKSPDLVQRDPTEMLFIAKTGGTTGEPKNVMLSDNGFNILVHQYLHTDLPYDSGDRWLRLWPIFSATAAVSSLHLAICAGMESVIRNFPLNIADFDKMVIDEKPNHLILIPQLLDVLERSTLLENEDLSFIKSAGCGGLSITEGFEERVENFFKRFNLPIFLGYGWGCTENSSSAAMRMNKETTKIGFVGIPLPNTVVSVFDPDNGNELAYDEEGELCILSFTAMLGYYDDSNKTDKVLKKHSDGKVWIHTGDLGTVSRDGFVKIHGRMTRTIFVFPTAKIYPTSMENIISTISGVIENAVIGVPNMEHEGFEIPICFVVIDKNYNKTVVIEEATKLCCREYMEHERPSKIVAIDHLPITKAGKIDYNALETMQL